MTEGLDGADHLILCTGVQVFHFNTADMKNEELLKSVKSELSLKSFMLILFENSSTRRQRRLLKLQFRQQIPEKLTYRSSDRKRRTDFEGVAVRRCDVLPAAGFDFILVVDF